MKNAKTAKPARCDCLTKFLAVMGTLLAWFPILAPILLSVFSIIERPRFIEDPGMGVDPRMMQRPMFNFDWLIPAELFPFALLGAILLIWASLRARSRRKLIIWSFVVEIGILFTGQAIASFTGLASGETEPAGWPWALVIGSIAAYCLALVVVGVGGVLLVRDLFKASAK